MAARTPRPLHVAARVVASTVGAWALTWAFAAFGTTLFYATGLAFAEASGLATMLAFVVLLVACVWALAARSVARVWLVLAGGGAAMTLGAWLLSRGLTA